MNDEHFILKNRPEEYVQMLNPTKDYYKQSYVYLSKLYKLSEDELKNYIKRSIKDNKPKNPIVTYNIKNQYGDMEKETIPLSTYLKDIKETGDTIVPSLTVYTHPTKDISINAAFQEANVAKRKEHKNLAFKYKLEGDNDKFNYNNIMQKIKKISNNSMSGAYGAKGTILFNPSAHYSLTSMTRCLASIGNMTSESMVAGNKYFKNPEVTINYVIAIISTISKLTVGMAIKEYNLHIPTSEEIMESILYSSRRYWYSEKKEQEIKNLLDQLDDVERCAVLYTNDLFHFKKYNDVVCRDLIKGLSTKHYSGCEDPFKTMTTSPEGIDILTHSICADDIVGVDINYKDIKGTDLLTTLGSTAQACVKTLIKYKKLFKAFYTTNILPTSISYVKDMLRDAIVLSDTDSTCASYDTWVIWYFGKNRFDSSGISVAAAVMTICSQIIDHHIKVLCKNMNICPTRVELLKMKNEFYWPVFIPTNMTKHYMALVAMQEGRVLKDKELELKGVHLIAGGLDRGLAKFSHNLMIELMNDVIGSQEVELKKYVDSVANKEREILNDLKGNKLSLFGKITIKDKSTYKNGPDASPYKYVINWDRFFSKKYGKIKDTPVRMYTIPLILDNKTAIKDFLDNIDDVEMKVMLIEMLKDKNDMKVLRVPVEIANVKGIPEEFKNVINYNKTVSDNLKPSYYLLESIGFFKKEGSLISENGY